MTPKQLNLMIISRIFILAAVVWAAVAFVDWLRPPKEPTLMDLGTLQPQGQQTFAEFVQAHREADEIVRNAKGEPVKAIYRTNHQTGEPLELQLIYWYPEF